MASRVSRALRIVLYAIACVALLGAPGFHGLTFDDGDGLATQEPAAASPSENRPAVLAPLYVSFAAMQILDFHSTMRASDFGGRETNPFVRPMLRSPAIHIAVKAGVTAGVIVASERLWKRNKAAAILMMVGLTSTYAAIVAHNYVVEAHASGVR